MKTNKITTEEIDYKPEDMVEVRGTLYRPKHYTLLIRLNDNCNLDCLYCTMHEQSKKQHTPYKTIMEYIEVIFHEVSKLDHFDSINYYFYGGEPTMYSWFEELVEDIDRLHMFSKLDYGIETQTNLTKSLEFFKRMVKYNINFICSYQNAAQNQLYSKHPNGQDEHINQFYKRAEFLMENDMTNGFDIMLEDPTSEHYKNSLYKPKPQEIRRVYRALKKLFYENGEPKQTRFGIQMNTIDSVPVPEIYQDIYNDHKIVSEKLFITLKDGTQRVNAFNDIISNPDYNNFQFWQCDVGIRQFMISFVEPQPKVWWCMSDMFAKTQPLASTADEFKILVKETFQKNKPARCLHKRCVCELFIPKRRKSAKPIN